MNTKTQGHGVAFRARVDKARVRAALGFLSEVLAAEDEGAGLLVDQDAARLAIATCLDLKDPNSPMKDEMYDAFTLHATNISVEGVCLRTNGETGNIEVLLQRRPDDDPRYRGQLAAPGQGIRVADAGPERALDRLTAVELKVPTRYEFVADVYVTNGLRGWYECKIYLAFPDGEPANASWYPADPLPPDADAFKVVRAHRERIVPVALAAYKERFSAGPAGCTLRRAEHAAPAHGSGEAAS